MHTRLICSIYRSLFINHLNDAKTESSGKIAVTESYYLLQILGLMISLVEQDYTLCADN